MATKWSRLYGLGYFGSGLVCAAAASAIIASNKEKVNEIPTTSSAISAKPNTEAASRSSTQVVNRTSNDVNYQEYQSKLRNSIAKAQDLCVRVRDELGLPGLVIGVSVNGKTIWDEGFGYSDLENRSEMSPQAVMRIASISKSMTMGMMAKLMEEGKIDIDLPIQTYLPDYPKQQVDGKDVSITTRDLLSHLSGIRHYWKKGEKPEEEMSLAEYFLKDKFETVETSLELFKNDELLHAPGTKYYYTTHGWTVVSAIIEKLTETTFPKHAQNMFKLWGLTHTYLDEHEPIIYDRSRYYSRDKKSSVIKNAPYVDNSYKWAGGGFLSSVGDLKQFAHLMIASLQNPWREDAECGKSSVSYQPYLKEKTMQQLWTGDSRTAKPNIDFMYGLGFYVEEPLRKCIFCKERKLMTVQHSGAAVGSTSILLMRFPKNFRFGYDEGDIYKKSVVASNNSADSEFPENNVKAVVVAMMTNMTDGGLNQTAIEIADLFEWLM